jgi:YfiH family protein
MSLQGFKTDSFIAPSVGGIAYGFFGRQGGVSSALYASLNCGLGSGDQRSHVDENRLRVARALDPTLSKVIGPYQVHGAHCVCVDKPWQDDRARPKADALVTNLKNCAIGVLTADCAPVLFYAQGKDGQRVIGAAHAGWKGALSGVLNATIAAMLNYDGIALSDIHACIGPCIAQSSYEVGAEFKARLLETNPAYADLFITKGQEGALYFDLPGFCARRLREAGIKQIAHIAQDTYTQEEQFFSYRRATHRAERDYGRQLSAIALLSG